MLVTDIERIVYKGSKSEKKVRGFYMDRWLKENLDDITEFLKKEWDCVGIVSGHGKVRIGKSTLAMQIAFYLAWVLAGGKTIADDMGRVQKVIKPTKPVRFSLDENIVFSAQQLQERAVRLYEKYGKNQVLLYDEGRQGLDSSRAMENINKGMEDFFQECGFMGHVIIIVLPNFFKLHEDYAVARSIFLVDVLHDRKYTRGYFNFYNDVQKEWLYFLGKKRLGVTQKYKAAGESFWGKFYRWLPVDKDAYEKLKKSEVQKKGLNRLEKNIRVQRDWFIHVLFKYLNVSSNDMSKHMKDSLGITLQRDTLNSIRKEVKQKIAAGEWKDPDVLATKPWPSAEKS